MALSPDVFYLPVHSGAGGQRLCLHHRPAKGETRAAVVYVHPFAEEMNKSRRVAALQSRAFAAAGCAVLQVDLFGCGDSTGDFGDATWSQWVQDVIEAATWLQAAHAAPVWLWGLRAGCLIATEAAKGLQEPCNFLLWQPPASGKILLQQFLRLQLAVDMLDGESKGKMKALRDRIAAGETVEVAGYRLDPALVNGLEAAVLGQPSPTARASWVEVTWREPPETLPASMTTIESWRSAGVHVKARAVHGPAFWQTNEIAEVPALIDASASDLTGTLPG